MTACSGSGCGGDSSAPGGERLRQRLRAIGRVILVMSGKGGVGKSTVAANLAAALSRAGRRVGLLDIDMHGPSIPTLLGLSGERVGKEGAELLPVEVGDLKVLSIGFLVDDPGAAVIWRGPMKMGVIEQLVADVAWGELDDLVIDAPPGTGDEPLSVCQLMPGHAKALLVTTPQAVALSDVRRSISFCRQLELPILGLIENMSGFACPACGEVVDAFVSGGGEALARETRIPFLGRIPLDPAVAQAGDAGRAFVLHHDASPTARAFEAALAALAASASAEPSAPRKAGASVAESNKGETPMRYAIPLAEGRLCMHFGHCQQFAILEVDPESKTVSGRTDETPPPHEPGVLPRWLAEKGVTVVIAGGMGQRAQALFGEAGIETLVGAPAEEPEALVRAHLEGTLQSGANVCDH
jgi:ATP-binding protein involved in chromosome partitioning